MTTVSLADAPVRGTAEVSRVGQPSMRSIESVGHTPFPLDDEQGAFGAIASTRGPGTGAPSILW
jgi:hypothetical protein